MTPSTLTNLLLTGILLMQAYALIFRAPRIKNPVPRNWRELEKKHEQPNNPPKFPLI